MDDEEMMEEWIKLILDLSAAEPSFRDAGRKIFRNFSFSVTDLNDITLEDGGYSPVKLTLLKKYYYNEESIKVAQQLWAKRLTSNSYGSVGISCYAHYVKSKSVDAPRAKHASVFGPCLGVIYLNQLPKKEVVVDCVWRTSEVVKKFSADIVFLREVLLLPNFPLKNLSQINFHFNGLTTHFMYVPIIFAHLGDPIKELEKIKKADKIFYDLIIKSTGRYLIPEFTRGIERHSQSMHVHAQVNSQLGSKMKKKLIDYTYANHPGHRKPYIPPEEK